MIISYKLIAYVEMDRKYTGADGTDVFFHVPKKEKGPLKISYILKEKHCNKFIHTIIDKYQSHNDLIINMLTRSHYIYKCVHTMYFAFF